MGETLLVFGGFDGRNYLKDIHVLDAGLTWTEMKPSGGELMQPRSDHTTAVLGDGTQLAVFGGHDGRHYLNDFWILNIEKQQWSSPKIVMDPLPSQRACCSLMACASREGDTELYLVGGFDGDNHLNDLWKLELNKPQVFAWGENKYGQLGIEEFNDSIAWEPETVTALSNVVPVSVACGMHHSAVHTSDGKVLAWGLQQFGQIGTDTVIFGTNRLPIERRPVDVTPVGQVAKSISCGIFSTASVDIYDGLWMWGWIGPSVHGAGSSRNAIIVKKVISTVQRVARGMLGRKRTKAVQSLTEAQREDWAARLIQQKYRLNKIYIEMNVEKRDTFMKAIKAAKLQAEREGKPLPPEAVELEKKKQQKQKAMEEKEKKMQKVSIDLDGEGGDPAIDIFVPEHSADDAGMAKWSQMRAQAEKDMAEVNSARKQAEQMKADAERQKAEAEALKVAALSKLSVANDPPI